MSLPPRHQSLRASNRFGELDGLRGIAALAVVGHHLLLVLPSVSNAYLLGVRPEEGSFAWYLTYTPLRLLVSGPEAVLVFFVLSGLVVALPALRRNDYDWMSYYGARAVRLGLPVVGAVFLASALRLAAPFGAHPSGWVSAAVFEGLPPERVIQAMDLIDGNYSINNPMWSLRWEMIFSLALPIYIAIAVAFRRRPWILLVATLALLEVGQVWGEASMQYLPVFLLGTIVACLLGRERRHPGPEWARIISGALLAALSALVLISPWLLTWEPTERTVAALPRALAPLGALGIVWCALR